MAKNLYIDASHPSETRVVLKNNENIEDYEYESINNTLIKNNIYLGKVSRIEPSLQAAFVDFGRNRHGFLSFNDIQSDYYQIPSSDLELIKAQEEKAREELIKESEINDQQIIDGSDENLNKIDPIEKYENLNEVEDTKNIKKHPAKRYKIQEVIKPNQVILVQVLKDERGQKGAALSTLFGYMISREFSNTDITVVSFASPRVGDNGWKKHFDDADNLTHYRILNQHLAQLHR